MQNLTVASKPRLRSFVAAALLLMGIANVKAAEVTVSGAASLTNAFKEAAGAFEAQNPGTKVLLNFAASDALLAQIAKGAPVDVFAAADQESMDKAEQQGLLAPGSRRNFVANSMVVIAPSDSTVRLETLADLQQDAVKKVTLGNPAGVPIGRYAKGALEAARLWTAVEPKAVYGTSVRQSLDYVARGEADAGFVYATDALVMKDKVKVAFTVPTETPVLYPVAIPKDGPNPADGRKFVDFLQSAPGQAILARYGFRKP